MGGRERFGLLAALACLLSLGCSLTQTQEPARYGPDINVGVPLAFTGNLLKEGAMAKQGYDLWLDWVNNHEGGLRVNGMQHHVRLLYEDDASKPDIDAQVTEKLLTQEKAQFLLGPYGGANTAAAAAVAEQHHVPIVSANGSPRSAFSKGYRYLFGVQTPADRNLQAMFDLAASLNPRPATVAFLSADDAFSVEVTKGAADYAAMKGFQVISNQVYPNGSTKFVDLLTQLKAKSPDIVVNSGHLVEAVALNMAAKDLRFEAKAFVYSVGPTMPDFVQSLGKDADYIFTGSQWTAQAKYHPAYYVTVPDYVAAYRKMFNTTDEPNYQVADATAAGLALQLAISHANSLDPGSVRDALGTLDVVTFFGRIKFDSTGQNTFKPMYVEQIQQSRRATVWPPEFTPTVALYPTPNWTVRSGVPPLEAQPPPPKLPTTGRPE